MKTLIILASACLAVAPSFAASISDAAGDFLPTYTGPQNGDLDVLESDVRYDGVNFVFDFTVNAPLGTTPGAVYVWGINRGSATGQFFPGVIDDVAFDWALAVSPGAFAITADLTSPAPPAPLPDGSVAIIGSRMIVSVAASLLPSTGFAPSDYLVSFWPRSTLTEISNVSEISDFAPQTGMAPVSSVPEPGTAALVLAAAGLGWWRMRRER
ncbi:MAG: PEP-CTERM sorting domain-containing protein [Bryobacteraceae bacterium]|nr:PEP-CTERM sorting domain-containing protein [Bryobacteraceae bacterium]